MKKYLILCELILVLFVSSCFFKVETLIFKEGKYELVLYDPYEYPICVYQDEIREFYIEDINIELIEISEEEFNDANGLNVIQNRVNKKFYNISTEFRQVHVYLSRFASLNFEHGTINLMLR